MKGAFAWSVRRELWEHRSIFIAPLVVGVLMLVAFLLNIHNLREKVAMLQSLDAARQQVALAMPFAVAESLVLLVSFVVGAFYCFDALNSERRDRSILFWKSMPVSDTATVLSKAFVALAVQPAIGMAVALATQVVLLVLSLMALGAAGVGVAPMWAKLPVLPMVVSMVYVVVIHVLWFAPAFAFFLLLSAWLRRPFLWFAVSVIVVQVLELIAFRSSHVGAFLRDRITGAMSVAFSQKGSGDPIVSLSQLDLVRFLSTPGLWVGLVFAAVFLFVAIRVRRSREPF